MVLVGSMATTEVVNWSLATPFQPTGSNSHSQILLLTETDLWWRKLACQGKALPQILLSGSWFVCRRHFLQYGGICNQCIMEDCLRTEKTLSENPSPTYCSLHFCNILHWLLEQLFRQTDHTVPFKNNLRAFSRMFSFHSGSDATSY